MCELEKRVSLINRLFHQKLPVLQIIACKASSGSESFAFFATNANNQFWGSRNLAISP
jgi:hypothetical protein